MPEEVKNQAQREMERLEKRKRLAYMVALACGVLIFLLSWIIREPDDLFILVLYPFFALVLALMLFFVWRRSFPLQQLEAVMFTAVSAMILGRLAWHFHLGGELDDHLLMLAGGHYWSVGVLIVGGFVMLDHKKGIIAGTLVILASISIAATGIAGELQDQEVSGQALIYLARIHLFLGLLLGLAAAATTLRDKYRDALIWNNSLQELASTDMLTGLANRRAAEDFLEKQAYANRRYGRKVSVIMADVDLFKQVNDKYGHSRGDMVLVELGRILRNSLRETDLVARWGGEEFLIVAPEIDMQEAKELAERCRCAIASRQVAGINLTMSFGVTELREKDSVDTVLSRADNLLYKAKSSGRNLIVTEA